jgi:gamma-glutamylcyclotransferase (GGCT)/AIG2-like uncharacterized protein YtfP
MERCATSAAEQHSLAHVTARESSSATAQGCPAGHSTHHWVLGAKANSFPGHLAERSEAEGDLLEVDSELLSFLQELTDVSFTHRCSETDLVCRFEHVLSLDSIRLRTADVHAESA